MTKHRRKNGFPAFFLFFTVAALLILSACNFSTGAGSAGEPGDLVKQIVQQTFAAMTQAAGLPADDPARQTQEAQAAAQTETSVAFNAPVFTPTTTPTPTPGIVQVSVSRETNCRSGPGPAYEVYGILRVGQTAEVVGRNFVNDTWIIKLPSNPAITCWVWGQYASVTGNWESLPIIKTPPTPTPTLSG